MVTPLPESAVRHCVICGPIPDDAPDCPYCGTSIPPVDIRRSPPTQRDHLGRYRLLREIAAGGSAVVYKASDPQIDRIVALKVISGAAGTIIPRLHREANLAGNLQHPNIITVHEVGALPDADGAIVHFICMDFVDGPTLGKPGSLPRRARVEMIEKVARALHFAHERGVIHRDVKPENILVRDGAVPILTDFGLAREVDSRTKMTATNMIMGTPSYMAPEQLEGPMSRVGRAADIYALGATLYELSTGAAPFDGAGASPLFQRILQEEPEPMRRRDPSIDRDLDTIVLKCLEKEPARRYATAAELADDLRRYLESRAISARPASPAYRLRKFVARRPAVAVVAAALVVAGALAIAQAVASSRREAAMKELAARWNDVVVARQGIYKGQMEPSAVRADLEAATARLTVYIEHHPDMAEAHHVRARAWLYLGRIEEAERDARRAVELDGSLGPAWALLGRVLVERYDASLVLGERGDVLLTEAKEALRRAADLSSAPQEESLRREDRIASAIANALFAYYVDGKPEEGIRLLEEINAREDSEEIHGWIGNWYQGRPEAQAHLERAVEVAPHYAAGHALLGYYHWRDGPAAEPYFRRALAIDERMLAPLGNLAILLVNERRYDEAEVEIAKALELYPAVARFHFLHARVAFETGDADEAVRSCTRALDLAPDDPRTMKLRALALEDLDRFDDALADWEAARRLDPTDVQAIANAGFIHLRNNDLDDAAAVFDAALRLDPGYFPALAARGEMHLHRGEYKRAVERLRAAVAAAPDDAKRSVPQNLLREAERLHRESDF